MSESDVIDVLATCIEAVEDGRSTIADCLASYPEHVESLSTLLPLAVTLRQAPEVAPTPVFRQAARRRLVRQLAPQATGHSFWSNIQRSFTSSRANPQLNTLARVVFLLLIAFSLIGVGLTYANGAVPGDSLYELDRSLEDLRLQLALDDTTALYLHLTFVRERLLEAKELFARGQNEVATSLLVDLDKELIGAEEALGNEWPESVKSIEMRPFFNLNLTTVLSTTTPTMTATPVMAPTATPTLALIFTAIPSPTLTATAKATPLTTPTAMAMPVATVIVTTCTGTEPHPRGVALANQLAVVYDEIMGWFCADFGFGEIEQAYELSAETNTPVADIFAWRQSGLGWGQIRQQLTSANHGQNNSGNNGHGNGSNSGNGNSEQGNGGNGHNDNDGSGNGGNGPNNGNNGQGHGGNNGQGNGGNNGNGQGNGNQGNGGNNAQGNGGGKKNK